MGSFIRIRQGGVGGLNLDEVVGRLLTLLGIPIHVRMAGPGQPPVGGLDVGARSSHRNPKDLVKRRRITAEGRRGEDDAEIGLVDEEGSHGIQKLG